MSQRQIIKLSEFKLENMIFHFEFGTVSPKPKEETKPPLPILFILYLRHKNTFPKELWNIIGKFYRKLQFDDIVYRLRRHQRSKFSLSMSGPTLVLRTSKKSIKNTIDKIYKEQIHVSSQDYIGPWLCKNKHKLVGKDEHLNITEEGQWSLNRDFAQYQGKCYCIDDEYLVKCGPSTITNSEVTFLDILLFLS